MVRRALLLLPLVAVVLALAACGGGSATLTKAQYAAKVSHLCLLTADEVREIHPEVGDIGDLTSIVHIDKEFLKQLAALQPPASIAAAAAGYAREMAKAAQDNKNAMVATKAGDRFKLYAAMAQRNHDGAAAWPYAKTMGATGCYP